MSSYRDEPWTDREKNFLLAEIIKHAPIPPQSLFAVLVEHNVTPDWQQILMPQGRNMLSCQRAYRDLQPPDNIPRGGRLPAPFFPDPTIIPPNPRKRPQSFGETPVTTGRQLQPRPSFASLNGEDLQGSPDSSTDPTQPAKKKRGRPTKAVAEARKAEALAKGLPYPAQRTPRTPKAPKTSASPSLGTTGGPVQGEPSGPPTATTATPQVSVPVESPGSSSSVKKRGRRKDEEQAELQSPTAPFPGPLSQPIAPITTSQQQSPSLASTVEGSYTFGPRPGERRGPEEGDIQMSGTTQPPASTANPLPATTQHPSQP